MKNIINAIFAAVCGLVNTQSAHSQGSTYISNLALPSTGTAGAANDAWVAEGFETGNNPGGYLLDSVQLGMAAASGTPSGFSVMLYTDIAVATPQPGTSLGTLSGSSDPDTAGLYTYTSSGLSLAPSTSYYIVLRSGSPETAGTFNWNIESTSAPSANGGWLGSVIGESATGNYPWYYYQNYPEYALTATAVPEPDTLVLCETGGLLAITWGWQGRVRAKKRSSPSGVI